MNAVEDRVRALAADVLGVEKRVIRSVERIEQGLTNENWIARTAQKSIIVRLNSPNAEALGVDRRSEERVLRIAAQAGVGPRVLRCDPDAHVLIAELLPGTPWSVEYARSTAGIARLAALMRDVHALSIADGIKRVDALNVVEHYWSTLDRAGQISLAGPADQRAAAQVIGKQLRDELRPRLCHNDVHHLNLMDDGSVRLLDWEYAGIGDPYFDLAGICCYHDYDADQCEQLLQHYLGREDDKASSRLDSARWMFNYIRDLWTAVNALPAGSSALRQHHDQG
ncbi:MAG: choline kinase family protein [Steroidobacteraceae bacterium]